MKYRFRISERQNNTHLPLPLHRRYRLRGAHTLRRSREKVEHIRLSPLFEVGELPEGTPVPKKQRKKKLKRPRQKKHLIRKILRQISAGISLLWTALQKKAARAGTSSLPIFAGALCAALLVSFVSMGTVLLHLFGGYHAPYTSWLIPDFLGKEPQAVLSQEQLLHGEALPWQLVIQYADHAEIPEGQVISQSPSAGVTRRVYRNGGTCRITLTVSRGLPSYELDDLSGKTERDARLILQNHGIEATVQEMDAEHLPKGTVLRTLPSAGTVLHKGDRVILQLAKGASKQMLSVPSLLGLTEERAATLLRAKGFSVGRISYESSPRPAGTVIAQSPSPSAELAEGSSVSYTVSIGQSVSLRKIPSLCGLSYADAVARLKECGLVVGAIYSIESAAPRGTVLEQFPAAGTPITSSTVSVDLYLCN